VPKKIRAVSKDNPTPTDPTPAPEQKQKGKPSVRGTASAAKKAKSSAKKTSATRPAKPRSSAKAVKPANPTDEEVRLRAYFVSERRHRLGLAGDASSDWLEAKRQLLSEAE
jgi:hypothetical protein